MSVATAKKISEGLAKTLVGSAAEDALISFSGLPPKTGSISQLIEQISLQLSLAHYQYSHFESAQKIAQVAQAVTFQRGISCSVGDARRAALAGTATGQGANLTRELVNLPGTFAHPNTLPAKRVAWHVRRIFQCPAG